MDGVIAVYERHAYIGDFSETAPIEKKPLFLREKEYFKQCLPDMTIIRTLELLNQQVPVQILTNIVDGYLKPYHTQAKKEWIKQYMPFIDVENQFHAITVPKATYVQEHTQKKLTMLDTLISDYNKDLVPWSKAGGRGIKYLNGINSANSYQGEHISSDMTPEEICEIILQIK